MKLKFTAGQKIKSLSISLGSSLPIKVQIQQNSEQEYLLHISIVHDEIQNISPRTIKDEIIVKLDSTEDDKKVVIPITLVISG